MKALVVVLVLVLGLAVVLDRVAHGYAEDRVAEQIAERSDLAGVPEVEIEGFPFLTQAIGGRYDDVRLSITAEQLRQPEGTRADVVLRGVEVPLSDVLSGSVREVPVEQVDGTATLSYALLSQQLGADTELTREGERLRITRTVEVLGRELRLTAVGDVVLDGDDLVVDVQEVSGAGIEVPDLVLDRAEDLLDLRYSVPPLPFGLRLTGVRPADDGVDLRVEASDTVLTASG